MASEIELDAELQIEIVGYSPEGVTLKLKLYRKRQEGFREDAMWAMCRGEILKEFDYPALPVGSVISFNGIKAKVEVEG